MNEVGDIESFKDRISLQLDNFTLNKEKQYEINYLNCKDFEQY